MRKNAYRVSQAWLAGRPASGGHALHTDGTTVWSYDMAIAQRRPDGAVEIIAPGASPTPTTTQHIRGMVMACVFGNQPFSHVQTLTGHAPHVFRRQQGVR